MSRGTSARLQAPLIMRRPPMREQKTAFLDQVAQHKPSLSPAIDLIRNRRRREMEELLSKGGGTNLQ